MAEKLLFIYVTRSCVINSDQYDMVFFLCYRDIGTKFPPILVMTNFCWKIYRAHMVKSPFPIEFSPYA
jgi:hypothetical protein